MNAITYRQRIEQKLTESFAPILLEIKDDSQKHAGHAGHNARGESHFIVKIVSAAFEGIHRVERHRMVYAALKSELQERVHALNIQALTPAEYNHK